MIEWVLIILFAPYGQPATSLAVPGFSDEKTCHDAANFVDATYNVAKSTCVQSKK